MTFFEITPANITEMLTYSGSFIEDFLPFLLVILGLSIGIMILNAIIKAVR